MFEVFSAEQLHLVTGVVVRSDLESRQRAYSRGIEWGNKQMMYDFE